MSNNLEIIKRPAMEGNKVALTDSEENIYMFDYFVIGQQRPVPECAGVYAFCGYDGKDIEILYIGHSDCLARTLTVDVSWHSKWRIVNNEGAHLLIYLSVPDGRSIICASLIESYKPRCGR